MATKESARFKPLGIYILEAGDENVVHWFLEDLIIEKTKNHILAPGKIDELAQMVVDKFNEELEKNIVLKCLNRELAQVNASIFKSVKNV